MISETCLDKLYICVVVRDIHLLLVDTILTCFCQGGAQKVVLERIMLGNLCLSNSSRHWIVLSWWVFVIAGHLLVYLKEARAFTICSILRRVTRVRAEIPSPQS